ncbi:MAG: 50S ribosomal protein L22 [Nanoarchaeota archaeon]|nr:50S ribosomal protein L22 [Nanoarchaeota archaeon]
MVELKQARVVGSNLPISTKHSVEIASFIRGREVNKALQLLESVVAMKVAVPFKRYMHNVGHKPGHVGPGRYPEKASRAIILLLRSLIANAQQLGMDTNSLYVHTVMANQAARSYRGGRQRRRKAKRTNMQIFAAERVVDTKVSKTKSASPSKIVAQPVVKVAEQPKLDKGVKKA